MDGLLGKETWVGLKSEQKTSGAIQEEALLETNAAELMAVLDG